MRAPLLLALLSAGLAAFEYMPKCDTSAECEQKFNANYACIQNHCHRKSLLPPNGLLVFGFVVLFLVSALTNAGGIGGKAVMVPLICFFFGYYFMDAIAIARLTILGGGVITFVVNGNKGSPDHPNRPLNDYPIAAFIVPVFLAGSFIGVILTKWLPPSVILIIMVVYMMKISYTTYTKAVKYSHKEKTVEEQITKKLLAHQNHSV